MAGAIGLTTLQRGHLLHPVKTGYSTAVHTTAAFSLEMPLSIVVHTTTAQCLTTPLSTAVTTTLRAQCPTMPLSAAVTTPV